MIPRAYLPDDTDIIEAAPPRPARLWRPAGEVPAVAVGPDTDDDHEARAVRADASAAA